MTARARSVLDRGPSLANDFAVESSPPVARLAADDDGPNLLRWQLLLDNTPAASIIAQRMAQEITQVPAAKASSFDATFPAWRLPTADTWGSTETIWGGVPDELIPDGLLIDESDYVSEVTHSIYAIFIDGSVAKLEGEQFVEVDAPIGSVSIYRISDDESRLVAEFIEPPDVDDWKMTERTFPMTQGSDLSYISEIMWPTTGWLLYKATAIAPENRLDGMAIWIRSPFSPESPSAVPDADVDPTGEILQQSLPIGRDVYYVDPEIQVPDFTKVIVSARDPQALGIPADNGTVWIQYTTIPVEEET